MNAIMRDLSRQDAYPPTRILGTYLTSRLYWVPETPYAAIPHGQKPRDQQWTEAIDTLGKTPSMMWMDLNHFELHRKYCLSKTDQYMKNNTRMPTPLLRATCPHVLRHRRRPPQLAIKPQQLSLETNHCYN